MSVHRDHRSSLFRWTLAASVMLLGATIAAEAGAGERHHDRRYDRHHDGHEDRRHARIGEARAELHDARAIDRRLDRRGDRIDRHLDMFAFVAAAGGHWELANHLDRKGDRIERRLDRRGDRIVHDARRELRNKKNRGHVHRRHAIRHHRHGRDHLLRKWRADRHQRRDRHVRDQDRRDRRDGDVRDRKHDRKRDRDRKRKDRHRDRDERSRRISHPTVDGARLGRMLP